MRYLRAVSMGLGLGVALLAWCLHDIQISLAQARMTMLESCVVARNNEMNAEMDTLRKQLQELQSWRVQVSLASRMGWNQAHRFIREQPLVMPEGE